MNNNRNSFLRYALLCVLLVGAFKLYRHSFNVGKQDLASSAEEKVVEKISQLNQAVQQMTPQGDDLTCTCQMGDKTNILSFENPESCGPDRNYLQASIAAFKKIDKQGVFTAPRDYSETADLLPRKCALFIMRKFWKDRALSPQEKLKADEEFNRTAEEPDKKTIKDISEYKQDPAIYAKCDQASNGKPERNGHKACVTEDYVNLVYNSLIDVADCLEVPPKFIAPKLSNESGLHINAFGIVNDGGIGQFTNQALEDVKENYPVTKNRIMKSNKESCRRLRNFPGAVPVDKNDILSGDENRCHAISTPPNPLRSLIYYGVFFHATKRNALGAFEKNQDSKDDNFKSVADLMVQAGIADFDKEKIKEMLFVMAYNSGPGRPVVFFKEWLKYRIQNLAKHPITKADFDTNYWPESAQMKEKVGEARASLVKQGDKPLTLPQYLFAYKDSLYIVAVKAQARRLVKGLGEGTCTEAKFLEL